MTHSSAKKSVSKPLKAVLLVTSSMTVMAGATIAPALPELKLEFAKVEHIDYLVRLVLTIPALFIALLAPLSGWLLDRTGRKSVMLSALFLYSLAGSSGLYLQSLGAILVGRALLGVAVEGLMTSTTTLIVDFFDDEERHRFMGLQSAFMGYGGVVFLIAGGLLADASWRAPFAVYMLGLLVLPFAWRIVSEPDLEHEDDSAREAAGNGRRLPVALILLIYFVVFFGFAVFYLVPTQLPFLLKSISDVSNAQVGLSIAINSLVAATVASQYARLRRNLSPVSIIALMFGLWGVGYWLVALSQSFWQVLAALSISGLGFGMLMPNLNVWMARLAPVRWRGRLMSGMTMSVFVGQFLSPVLSQPLVRATGLKATFGIAASAAWCLGALFLIWAISRRMRR